MKIISYLISVLVFLFCFCSNNNSNKKSISSELLEINFIQKGLNSPTLISCAFMNTDSFKKSKHHKSINDTTIIKNFKNLYAELSASKIQHDIDVRIQIIYSNDKKRDTICMGEFFNITVNGVNMNDSKDFHSYIKEIIDYENTIRHPITGKMIK